MSESKPNGNGVARFNLWSGIGASILTFLASVFVGGYWMANLQSAVDAQAKATTAQVCDFHNQPIQRLTMANEVKLEFLSDALGTGQER